MTFTKTRVIKARLEHGYVILSENTYPIRNDIRAHGFTYHASDETWRALATPDAVAYARTISQGLPPVDTTSPSAYPTDAPSVTIVQPTVDRDADSIAAVGVQIVEQARRRIKRAADAEPAQTPSTSTSPDIAAALAAFVASIAPTQAPTQAPVDLSQVGELIQQALEPIRRAIDARPSTQLVITTPDTVRTIDGLHHHLLPTLIKALSAKVNVWLAGPSQGGKTTAARAAAKALGLTFHFHSSMTMAHELVGFVDGAGHYHETQFVKAFRNGGLVLLDELDRGSNEALLALNAPLANKIMSLPNGEIIEAHPDFRCIGAANTWGAGATGDYVGAARIDAAFLQRFGARLAWDYDTTLEAAICGNQHWALRVQAARAKARAAGLKVLITPQASISGAALLAVGFSDQQVADMTFLADLTPAQRQLVQ